MELDYRKLLKENKLALDSDILDPAFVAKAKEFEERLENKSLTDDQIKQWDDDLIKMFNELHTIEEEDSPEVQAAKRKADIAEAKEEITQAESIEQLKVLQKKFQHLPELAPFMEKRIDKFEKTAETEQRNKVISEAIELVNKANYNILPDLEKQYSEYPQVVKVIQSRIEKEKPAERAIREKLAGAKKREWTFQELREIGIEPTGDDMEIEGVTLERQYLFRVYHITKVDGKRV